MNCQLDYLKLDFILSSKEYVILPSFLGSTLRGALGTAMKKKMCKFEFSKICKNCSNRTTCNYTFLFTHINDNDTKNSNTKPNPFIIKPPLMGKTLYQANDILGFSLILIGNAIDFAYDYIDAVNIFAKTGLGYKKSPFELLATYCNGCQININDLTLNNYLKEKSQKWSYTDELKKLRHDINLINFNLLTPTRITTKGKLINNSDLDFESLMCAVFRRLSTFAQIYCNNDWEIRYDDYLKKASLIKAKESTDNLTWFSLNRYSNRAKEKIDISGLVGSLSFCGDLTPFMPFLTITSILHVGKGCTYGLGSFEAISI